jgi:hypothetical protein
LCFPSITQVMLASKKIRCCKKNIW